MSDKEAVPVLSPDSAAAERPMASSKATIPTKDAVVNLGGSRSSAELSAELSYPLTADEYFILAANFAPARRLSSAQLTLLSLAIPLLISTIVSVFTLSFVNGNAINWGSVIVLMLYVAATLSCAVSFAILIWPHRKPKASTDPFARLVKKIIHHLKTEDDLQ
jgi:hypothetical protein